ncbi:hypothetical protein PGT21_006700 [Puccinia graminis f. sp. tritici]|uniref:Uncharacterized protein n=1 Tax=Puccinia graminis f. sp. tritici TaxID=56615 RepID=A0A5B0MKS5_PUCGR|nr:hypothetical protein PGT21_006700 [Puccinia graminis f. sp. tritici]
MLHECSVPHFSLWPFIIQFKIQITDCTSIEASPSVVQASVQSFNVRSLALCHEEFIVGIAKEDPKAIRQTAMLGKYNHESLAKFMVRQQGTKP